MSQQSRNQVFDHQRRLLLGKWKNLPELQANSSPDIDKFNFERQLLSANEIILLKLKERFLELDMSLKSIPVNVLVLTAQEHISKFQQQELEFLQCLLGMGEAWISKRRMLLVVRAAPLGASPNQTGKGKVLRYYNNSTPSGGRPPSVAQTLVFSNQRWDTSGMPALIPQELWDMRREENRLKSFQLPDSTFAAAHLVSVTDLAADGFFYLQESDRVKCAFCKGVLKDWEAGEQVREAHRRHFSTCPFVLFVEVGNVPREDRDASVRSKPVACSEESSDTAVIVSGSWSCKLFPDAPPMEPLAMTVAAMARDSCSRPIQESHSVCHELLFKLDCLPVSAETARSACSEKALLNLSALQHRFESEASSETAKHPEFASFSSRLTSLQTALVLQPDYLLAKAGFFCMNDQRVTCCFSCDLRMKFWTCDDDVWIEHARWSPRCPHVLVERGCDFVLTVHRLLPPVMPPVQPAEARSQDPALSVNHSRASAAAVTAAGSSADTARTSRVDEALALTPGVEFRVEARDIKARADLPVVRLLTQLGFPALQVRLFTELHLRVRGDDFESSELFLHYMFCESRRMRELSLDPEAYFQSRMAEIRRSLDQQPNPRESIDWKTCKVCMDKEVNVVLLDCGHVASCSVCSKSLKTCPICRAFIRGTLVIRA